MQLSQPLSHLHLSMSFSTRISRPNDVVFLQGVLMDFLRHVWITTIAFLSMFPSRKSLLLRLLKLFSYRSSSSAPRTTARLPESLPSYIATLRGNEKEQNLRVGPPFWVRKMIVIAFMLVAIIVLIVWILRRNAHRQS